MPYSQAAEGPLPQLTGQELALARISACRDAGNEVLDLFGLGLTTLPESLRTLTHLTTLRLRDNELESLPEWLGDLRCLTRLHADDNRLAGLPESLGNLTRLEELILNNNQLRALPASLRSLTRLADLRLDANEFDRLPEWLGDLTGLTRFDADSNRIRTLPESLGNLTRLITLYLNNNMISELPELLGNLSQLEDLYLSDNRLAHLPESLGNLTRLTMLNVGSNVLESVPESLRNSAGLKELYLSDNRLTSLPEWLGDLGQLATLHVDSNRLAGLPESLGNLTQLIQLDFDNNALVELPESLGDLTRLEQLFLSNNRLRALPASLGELTGLTTLQVHDNPLTTPPPEIVSAGTHATLLFLAEMNEDPVQQWASKIVVVGEGRVGKTSLLKALRGQPHDAHEESTHGLIVDTLDLAHPDPPGAQDVTMRLSTWDFGGQEIYHATHQFFLTDRSLFLLLWDAQIGWEGSKLHYWLDMIKARAPQAPVVLVATHLGPRPPDLPLAELKDTYPGLIVASLSADSASGAGVGDVREVIRREAARLPLMGAAWPRRWLGAADAVRSADAKHITPERLYEIMTAHGVSEISHQLALTSALHSLGELLFYPEDEELSDLVVLHPQWLTTYISRVLDSERVLHDGGVFQHALGNEIWRDVDRAMRRHFIRMMENFDLSYRTEDRASSLVVELLPWDPPDYQEQWDALLTEHRRELRLRYRLHTVPPGIPTWFIAREHRFSTPVRWRSGALVRHTDGAHFGLVTLDRHAKTAELRVRGPYPHDFFSVLKDGFEQTLQRYPGLEIVRSVPCPHLDGDGVPCRHEFRHAQLVARLSRKPPRETIECPEHLDDLDVRMLLQGIEPPSASRSEILASQALSKLDGLRADARRHHDEMRGRLDATAERIHERLDDTRAEVSAVIAEQQRAFLGDLRRAQMREEVMCPSLVWVRRAARQRPRMSGMALELHLCCEAPGEWHLLDGVKPYEVRAASDMTAAVLPYVQRALSILKYVVPVLGAAIGVASEDLGDALAADVEFMKSLLDALPADTPVRVAAEQGQSVMRAEEHAEYRQMYALLKKLDPEEGWGGLNKVTTPEGHTYWLCRHHTRTYRPAVPQVDEAAVARAVEGSPQG
jgi:internalin A